MNTTQTEVSNFLTSIGLKPVSFYPVYKLFTGSLECGILLSQIMYLSAQIDFSDFCKTDTDFMNELNFSKREFNRAKKAIKDLPFIKTYLNGIPAKTYYSVDCDLFLSFRKSFKMEE